MIPIVSSAVMARIVLSAAAVPTCSSAGGGFDTLFGDIGKDGLGGGSGKDNIYTHDGDGTNSLLGAAGDRLFGGVGGDRMEGENGQDTLFMGQDDVRDLDGVRLLSPLFPTRVLASSLPSSLTSPTPLLMLARSTWPYAMALRSACQGVGIGIGAQHIVRTAHGGLAYHIGRGVDDESVIRPAAQGRVDTRVSVQAVAADMGIELVADLTSTQEMIAISAINLLIFKSTEDGISSVAAEKRIDPTLTAYGVAAVATVEPAITAATAEDAVVTVASIQKAVVPAPPKISSSPLSPPRTAPLPGPPESLLPP